ncbi:hypothetical protein PMI29_00211 [Pseudomonas sp. GM49]|uniref:hypothetical protein n=1 Tax=Pseudomonas sp. GM49 TaxID=1144331 RepID=UPI0002708978|nr:hypothetical protein [Pseudomonas sp. GM49]EJM75874.1 hypothetical protein PMI29_00211 [Pseudomonas sp. GM49]
MRIFKQLLLLVAGLLASNLSLEAISSGGLGQNPHPAVLVSGQPQQCGQFHNFHRGSFHTGNRHFVPMHNQHFVPMRSRHFVLVHNQHFVPLQTRHFVPMDNRHFVPVLNQHFVPMDNRHFIPIHRVNSIEVIRGPGFSNQPFGSRHVHFVRQFDPRTGQLLIREFDR